MKSLSRQAGRCVVVCLLYVSALSPLALAQPPGQFKKVLDAERGVSADDLVTRALRDNKGLQAARKQTGEAQGLLRQAALRPNPGLEANFGSGQPLGSAGESELSIGYSHTFELGRKRERRVNSASIGVKLSERGVREAERQLRADVKARYVEALAAARNLENAEELLRLSQETSRVTEARVREKEGAPLDAKLIRVELGRLQSERVLFESQFTRAVLELKTLVGIEAAEPLLLKDDAGLPLVAVTLEAALSRALQERPDLQSARLAEDRGKAEVGLARAQGVPNLTGSIRYSNNRLRFNQFGADQAGAIARIHENENIIGVGISFPLPFRDRNQGNIEAAKAREESAQLRKQFLEQSIRQEVTAAFNRYQAAAKARAVFDQDITSQAEENLKIIRASYDLGEMRIIDVLNEQRRLVDTRRAAAGVQKEYGLAVVELERIVGDLGR